MLKKAEEFIVSNDVFSTLTAERFGPPSRGMIADEKVVCIEAVLAKNVRKRCFISLLTRVSN